jgi:hypothetical protein
MQFPLIRPFKRTIPDILCPTYYPASIRIGHVIHEHSRCARMIIKVGFPPRQEFLVDFGEERSLADMQWVLVCFKDSDLGLAAVDEELVAEFEKVLEGLGGDEAHIDLFPDSYGAVVYTFYCTPS